MVKSAYKGLFVVGMSLGVSIAYSINKTGRFPAGNGSETPDQAKVEQTWQTDVNKKGSAATVSFSGSDMAAKILAAYSNQSPRIVLVNNLGTSDSEYKDKGAIRAMVEQQIAQISEAGPKPVVIVFVGGNTESGVGRLIRAAQEIAKDGKFPGVTIKTAGVSGAAAALNAKAYGQDSYAFMNPDLDHVTFIGTDPNSWDAKITPESISEVPNTSLSFLAQSIAANREGDSAPFVSTEGGEITTRETLEFITALDQIRASHRYTDTESKTYENLQWEKVRPKARVVLRVGMQSGDKSTEKGINKGPKGATDGALALAMLSDDPAFKDLIDNMDIELNYVNKNGEVKFSTAQSTRKNSEELKLFAKKYLASNEGKRLLDASSQLDKAIADKDDATIKKLLRSDVDNAAQKQLGKDIKAAKGDVPAQTQELDEIVFARRLKSFRNIMPVIKSVVDASVVRATKLGAASPELKSAELLKTAASRFATTVVTPGALVDAKAAGAEYVDKVDKK